MKSSPNSARWPFVCLMAILMSYVALAIDSMLPALGQMGTDLGVINSNDTQYIVSSVFLGMSFGLIFFGPLSDSFGRKIALYIGLVIFMIGCLVSYLSKSFEWMIAGRLLQGLGGASCRVITLAMIRDLYEGRLMAKVMSFILIIFIIVPAIAPSLGQIIMTASHWRSIFLMMLGLGVFSFIWLVFWQEETLALEKRLPFSLSKIGEAILETVRHKISISYTIASSMIFGAFVGYLSSTQQIFQDMYKVGDKFALYFGGLALCVGAASFVNSRFVENKGMEAICMIALRLMVCSSAIFIPLVLATNGHPPIYSFLGYLGTTLFCFGLLYANFNTLAIQPLGHIAGIANSVISSIQTLISVMIGGLIGLTYDQSVLPLVLGFFLMGVLSLFVVAKTSGIKIIRAN